MACGSWWLKFRDVSWLVLDTCFTGFLRCVGLYVGLSFFRICGVHGFYVRRMYYLSHAFKTAKFLLVSNFFVFSIEAIPLKTSGDHPAHCIVHTTNKTIEQSSNSKRESTKRESLEENSRRVRTVAGALSFRQVTGESLIAR